MPGTRSNKRRPYTDWRSPSGATGSRVPSINPSNATSSSTDTQEALPNRHSTPTAAIRTRLGPVHQVRNTEPITRRLGQAGDWPWETFEQVWEHRLAPLMARRGAKTLEAFVHGLNGRRLKIEAGEQVYTDTETLFVPATVRRFEQREQNFQLYKAMVVHQWAQTWYGTWRIDVVRELAPFAAPERALACFHALETLRLDAKIKVALPGVYRQLQALRGEDKLLKKQPYGDDVDIDALVEALADSRHGEEMTERLFMRLNKLERNIAVMFMVDMSGSTKGWINDAEREALALLCEALETLGDRYAIYGFSGMTRKRCELYRVKAFDEPYSEEIKARISGIRPKDYTRMGVTIRHLTRLLNDVEARNKLLITLSDGKPDDYDTYRGAYGIEDTRMALIEAKRSGIHPFCITIDTEARDYLPHMYGAVNYAVIDEVRKLPLKVSDIYRRLTT